MVLWGTQAVPLGGCAWKERPYSCRYLLATTWGQALRTQPCGSWCLPRGACKNHLASPWAGVRTGVLCLGTQGFPGSPNNPWLRRGGRCSPGRRGVGLSRGGALWETEWRLSLGRPAGPAPFGQPWPELLSALAGTGPGPKVRFWKNAFGSCPETWSSRVPDPSVP